MYIYFDEKGKCFWSDTDYSIQDKIPYYPAPQDIKPGTICKLVNNKLVAMSQNEIDELVKKEKKEFFITKHISLVNKICENNILKKYSRDDQRNIDRDALHLKALQAIDKKRLNKDETALLITHKKMSEYINNQLKTARELKKKIQKMSFDELQAFDFSQHWEEVKHEGGLE